LTLLLGPVHPLRATGRIGSKERLITAPGAAHGTTIQVETFTTVHALLTFCCGAEVAFLASWDVWGHEMRQIEIYGTRGSLRMPNPNYFDRTVQIYRDSIGQWESLDASSSRIAAPNYHWRGGHYANYRGAGLAEMAIAILDDRSHRCSGRFALHTLAVLTSIVDSADNGGVITLVDTCEIPSALTDAEARDLFR
jgi:predicted dehydrogenase